MPPKRLAHSTLVAALLVLALAAGFSAASQEHPNFTGEWLLDLKSSQLHEDYRLLERGVVRIDHREPAFTFRRTFFVKERPNEASYDASTDGREHRGVSPDGSVTVSMMHWEQMALVVEQRISDSRAGELNNKVRYELLDGGKTLQAIEDFTGGGRTHHNVWIFRRQ